MVVLMDRAAQAITPVDRPAGGGFAADRRLRRPQVECAVWPLAVVVLDVRAEHVLKVAVVADQQPVQTLGADRAHEPLGDRVRLWCPDRCLDDLDPCAANTSSKGPLYLLSRSRIKKLHAGVGEVETEVARLLCHPLAGRIPRAAREPDPPAPVGDEEEHVEAAKQDRLNREEVAGAMMPARLSLQELAPARAVPARRWPQSRLHEHAADARRRNSEAKLGQLPTDPAVTPARVLARKP